MHNWRLATISALLSSKLLTLLPSLGSRAVHTLSVFLAFKTDHLVFVSFDPKLHSTHIAIPSFLNFADISRCKTMSSPPNSATSFTPPRTRSKHECLFDTHIKQLSVDRRSSGGCGLWVERMNESKEQTLQISVSSTSFYLWPAQRKVGPICQRDQRKKRARVIARVRYNRHGWRTAFKLKLNKAEVLVCYEFFFFSLLVAHIEMLSLGHKEIYVLCHHSFA